jgi:hypothetical protein
MNPHDLPSFKAALLDGDRRLVRRCRHRVPARPRVSLRRWCSRRRALPHTLKAEAPCRKSRICAAPTGCRCASCSRGGVTLNFRVTEWLPESQTQLDLKK